MQNQNTPEKHNILLHVSLSSMENKKGTIGICTTQSIGEKLLKLQLQ